MEKKITGFILFVCFILISNISTAQTSMVEIGTGSYENLGLPMEPFYVYSYTQSIFLQNELNISGKRIEKIYYHYNGNSAWEQDIVVYMGHTDSIKFTTRDSWIGFSELTEVFKGKMSVSNKDEWVEITLSKPFSYNNVDNLVIAFDENTDEYLYDGDEFYCSQTVDTLSIRKTDDFDNIDPASPTESDLDGFMPYRPNIKIQFADIPTTPKITLPVSSFEFHLREAMTKDSAYVEVYNSGVGDLVITGIASTDPHYYSTYSGTIPEGERDTVVIYYYPQSEGKHNDTLSFTSNTTLEDPAIIVTGEAYPEGLEVPTPSINGTYYYFAKIHENDSSFTGNIFELKNDSTGTLSVLSFIGLDGTEFSTNLNIADVALSGDDVYSFGFTYKPINPGQDTIIFTMQTNGGNIEFYLVGNAVPESYNIENFEGAVFPPKDWKIIDADGDYENWKIGVGDNPYTGLSVLSWSYDLDYDEPLTPDNWLITPKLVLSANDSLNYLCRAPNEIYFQEHYSVMLSLTGNNIGDFTTTLFSEQLENDAWNYRSVDLSSYSGQEVYIAFRHHNSTNMSALRIDEISFPPLASTTGVKEAHSLNLVKVFPNPTNGILNIVNAENATVYVYNVSGVLLNVYENIGNSKLIDISPFEEGTFIVQINTSDNKKIIKKVNLIK